MAGRLTTAAPVALPNAPRRRLGPRETVSTIERDAINLTIHYEDAGDGWVLATIPEVPGATSQGRTRAEARANVIDALQTVLTPDVQLAGRASAADDELLTLTVAE
jgi:predicted RNase H-like HicB family nuclease